MNNISDTNIINIKLKDILLDPNYCSFFLKFLEREFAQENVIFWLRVNEFRNTISDSERVIIAKDIFEAFIQPGAQNEINLSDFTISKTILPYFKSENNYFPNDMYNRSQKEIYDLMTLHSWPRFVLTADYKKIVAEKLNFMK